MTKEDAKSLVDSIFTVDVRVAFKNSICAGFDKYSRIINSKDYSSLCGYEKNGERRLLYSSVCSCLEGETINSVGFDTYKEQFTSSVKTHISNDKVIIDVFDGEHRNESKYQKDRFALNYSIGEKNYILIVYYCDKKRGILQRIMIRVPDINKNIIYEEDLVEL